MKISDSYRIRPAGRHLLTIGRDLIQDSYAAVVELVKNAYDADSEDVNILFELAGDGVGYAVTISDRGHGMSRDTVINKWMVPSTKDKLDRKKSPAGRVMQGRKGVGRYAASMLGSDLLLETVTAFGEKTTVFVEWDSFESAEYLDDVEVLVETSRTEELPGTKLIITGNGIYRENWSKKQFEKLMFELKKLISPISDVVEGVKEDKGFEINLHVHGFPEMHDVNETIKPYPIFDLFDYRIAGQIGADGEGELTFSTQKARSLVEEAVPISVGAPTGCGKLIFDIRVYDRDSESIESLIGRGLKDESGNYVGKLQAKQLLNDSNGIGVYRNGFRIRPLGDSDFDWLKMNEQRVQNPSMRIGINQAIGYVLIESEESSGLVEKSARDGLRENSAYERLRELTKEVIGKLEERRYSYRRKMGLSTGSIRVEEELDSIFSFDKLKNEIRKKLTGGGIESGTANEVIGLIEFEEKEKSKAVEEIRRAVATYQGQATLGKIISVVLHEGRRPLNYFKNEVPRMAIFRKKLAETGGLENISKIAEIAQGVEKNSILLSELFRRLDPLAATRRPRRSILKIRSEIESAVSIFRQEIEDAGIYIVIDGGEGVAFPGWTQDFQAIFANLIDNSVFWMKARPSADRKIVIGIESEGERLLHIDFRDTGPGIDPAHIESNVIFEPEFSTRPLGTGIGLAIAGEAAARNGLELKALESDEGAYFRLKVKDVDDE